jgi:competence protein ComEC
MKNMKNNLTYLLILMLIFSLTGCSSISEKTTTTVLASKVELKQNITKGNLKVHYINVGQAESILIEQGSSSMLIDAGNNEDANTVKNYIAEQVITKLNYIVGTHAHEDHIGGLDYVINSFKVGKIYMPQATSNTKTFEDVVSAIKSKGMKATVPKVLETFKVGDATATILAPSGTEYKDLNNTSIVIKLTFGNNSFMFTGDAEDISENEMLSKGLDISADVLKIGHHGSNSSTSQEFLDKVNPKYAVISVGIGNSYGHPHKTTMEKLKEKNIEVYRTDENGTIIATSDGENITFNTKVASYDFAGISSNSVPSTNKSSSAKTVYYTPKGKSYHYDKRCSTLSRSKTILTGTLGDALSSSHDDPCNECAGGK